MSHPLTSRAAAAGARARRRRALLPPLSLLLLLLLSLCVLGCAGTDVGNPEGELGLEFVALVPEAGALANPQRSDRDALEAQIDSLPQGQHMRPVSSAVELDEVWLVFDGVELSPQEDCNGTLIDALGAARPLVVELLSGLELPRTPTVQVGSAPQCRLRLTPGVAAAVSGAPSALEGSSLLVRGRRVRDGAAFELVATLNTPMLVNGRADPNGNARFAVDPRAGERLAVAFALATWFDTEVVRALDALDTAELAHLDEDVAPALVSLLAARVRRSVVLFRDLNGDGVLQPEEALEPIAASDTTGVDP